MKNDRVRVRERYKSLRLKDEETKGTDKRDSREIGKTMTKRQRQRMKIGDSIDNKEKERFRDLD